VDHRQSIDTKEHWEEATVFRDADDEPQIVTLAADLRHRCLDGVLAGLVGLARLKIDVHH